MELLDDGLVVLWVADPEGCGVFVALCVLSGLEGVSESLLELELGCRLILFLLCPAAKPSPTKLAIVTKIKAVITTILRSVPP